MIEFCSKSLNELHEYMFYYLNDNFFATICSEEEAEFTAKGKKTLFFRFCTYSEEEIARIKSQSAEWHIMCEREETWDPAFGYKDYKTSRTSYKEIRDNSILVQNGEFAGVVDYSKDLGDKYDLFYALTSDYIGEPIQFRLQEAYGSSDYDMFYEIKTFLLKNKKR